MSSELPVGLTPAACPKSGTSARSTSLLENVNSSNIRFWSTACCATKVVEAAGQPFPGPFKFWSVTREAWMWATLDALSCPVGKVTGIEGLFTAWPALTFAFKLCHKNMHYLSTASGRDNYHADLDE
jgi:hypothetical protein